MFLAGEKTLLVLVGPTAVGKTNLAIQLALFYKTCIVSADSRQFYKEMNIGTAKPTLEEREKVPHHFIDNLHVWQTYTSGDYEQEALQVLSNLFLVYDVVVLTGGSGLFVKAVCEGLDIMPSVNSDIRNTLNKEYAEKGLPPLLEELQRVDRLYYETVDKDNYVRVIRALEVCRQTGFPYSSFRKKTKKERPFKVVKIGLNRGREELYARIGSRVDQMLKEGLVDEVKSLIPYRNYNALHTVGYSEVFDFIDGNYGYDEMVAKLKQNTRNYAKRQMTWFRKDSEIHWVFEGEEVVEGTGVFFK